MRYPRPIVALSLRFFLTQPYLYVVIAFASCFIRLRIFDSRGYILFSLFLALPTYPSPFFSSLFPLSLSLSLPRSILPVQSACLLFILYHKTYIRIHSRVTRSYTTNSQMKQMLLLTENIHTYIHIRYANTSTRTYICTYIHARPNTRIHIHIHIHKIHVYNIL